MSRVQAILLQSRSVAEVSGPDAASFLQGLVTNDVNRAVEGRAVFAALLTPQGKIIHDFLIAAAPGGGFWLDCVKAGATDLIARLKRYKLRAKLAIAERIDLAVVALFDKPGVLPSAVVFEDPRLPALGWRALLPAAELERGFESRDESEYHARRLELGVPEGGIDIPPETLFPLDCNFEELHGVDFDKGCYVGQELTARMKHRATARRRMLPVTVDRDLPPAGTPLKAGAVDVGEMRGSLHRNGLALVRLDRLGEAQEITADGVSIRVGRPAYPLILPTGEQQ